MQHTTCFHLKLGARTFHYKVTFQILAAGLFMRTFFFGGSLKLIPPICAKQILTGPEMTKRGIP
jgi:hypothetical protein